MKTNFIASSALDHLKANVNNNIDMYKQNEPWLNNFFDESTWCFPANMNISVFSLKKPEKDEETYDLENTITIYNAMKDISITQAIDERLWVYMTHVQFWDYMRLRWPVERYIKSDLGTVELRDAFVERYFFMSNRDRALIRNGIARLWWYGHVSYDESREDPFELTKMLLRTLDITQTLLERRISRCTNVTKSVLSVLVRYEQERGTLPNRTQFRDLLKYINHLGGVTILDALESDDLETVIWNRLCAN